jgi:hypothetical protein
MTREEFIKKLDREGYSYEIEGDKIIVTWLWDVYLDDLTSLPPDVEFRNKGDVYLQSLTSLPPDVVFRNKGDVSLQSLIGGLGWFFERKGNIKGINSKRLLNLMISKGVFER